MTSEEIEATLALDPKEAAAIIKKQFRAKQTFETNRQGDKYFFLVDPTITIPSEVLEVLDETAAFDTAKMALWGTIGDFATNLVRYNDWGVVDFHIPRHPDYGGFLTLRIEPGFLERGGRIRRGVDPRMIPGMLVRLKTVKEDLNRSVKTLVDTVNTTRWWVDMGFLNLPRRKQDWSPREER